MRCSNAGPPRDDPGGDAPRRRGGRGTCDARAGPVARGARSACRGRRGCCSSSDDCRLTPRRAASRDERDHAGDGNESSPRNLDQPQECVAGDRHREARRALILVDRDRRELRLARPGEKSVRITLGEQLERAGSKLWADEDELGMQLPRPDLVVGAWRTFVCGYWSRPDGFGRHGHDAKPRLGPG